jgi:hypothetical protein
MALAVRHRDAVDRFSHHNSVLQNYGAMFLVRKTFSVSAASDDNAIPHLPISSKAYLDSLREFSCGL